MARFSVRTYIDYFFLWRKCFADIFFHVVLIKIECELVSSPFAEQKLISKFPSQLVYTTNITYWSLLVCFSLLWQFRCNTFFYPITILCVFIHFEWNFCNHLKNACRLTYNPLSEKLSKIDTSKNILKILTVGAIQFTVDECKHLYLTQKCKEILFER